MIAARRRPGFRAALLAILTLAVVAGTACSQPDPARPARRDIFAASVARAAAAAPAARAAALADARRIAVLLARDARDDFPLRSLEFMAGLGDAQWAAKAAADAALARTETDTRHGRTAGAAASVERSLAAYQKIGDVDGELAADHALAAILLKTASSRLELAAVAQLDRRSLDLARHGGDRVAESRALLDAADASERNKDHVAALAGYHAALATLVLPEDWRLAGIANQRIGDIYVDRADFERALASYQAALTAATIAADPAAIAAANDYLGYACRQLGDLATARAYHAAALQAATHILDHNAQLESRTRSNNHLGLVDQALAEEALARHDVAGAKTGYADAAQAEREVVAGTLVTGDAWREGYARRALSSILLGASKLEPPGAARTRLLDDAAANARQALTLADREHLAEWRLHALTHLGVAQARLGDGPAAFRSLDRALDLATEVHDTQSRAEIRRLRAAEVEEPRGLWAAATGDYAAALADFSRIHATAETSVTSCLLGDLLARRDDADGARRAYRAAIDGFEAVLAQLVAEHRSAFVLARAQCYDNYITLLHRLDQRSPSHAFAEPALRVLERKNARTLLAAIAAGSRSETDGVSPEIVGDLVRDASGTRPSTRDALGAHEAVLAYDVLPDETYLWVVTRSTVTMTAIPQTRATLEGAVRRLHLHLDLIQGYLEKLGSGAVRTSGDLDALAAADLPSLHADAHALYLVLVPAAIRPLLRDKSLIVVPSGPLFELAWEMLVTTPAESRPAYLIEQHPISYLPTTGLLDVLRERERHHREAPQGLLALAAPDYGAPLPNLLGVPHTLDAMFGRRVLSDVGPAGQAGGWFKPLRTAKAEAEKAREALAPLPSRVLTGGDASLASVLALNARREARTYRYVLFATHATLPGSIGNLSQPAIVLAHPERGNGFLTIAEIYKLKLNADLVVLSACKTAVGADTSGDGVSALTRAFFFAGTSAVSVTLWDMNDDTALALSPALFAGLAGHASPARALQAAKLRLLHDPTRPRFHHPYFWAASVLFGNGDSTVLTPPGGHRSAVARATRAGASGRVGASRRPPPPAGA